MLDSIAVNNIGLVDGWRWLWAMWTEVELMTWYLWHKTYVCIASGWVHFVLSTVRYTRRIQLYCNEVYRGCSHWPSRRVNLFRAKWLFAECVLLLLLHCWWCCAERRWRSIFGSNHTARLIGHALMWCVMWPGAQASGRKRDVDTGHRWRWSGVTSDGHRGDVII